MLPARLAKSVALVGLMGAGKTAVGRALARLLDVPFRDSDEEIEAAAAMTIAEIFARDGEAFFRAKESQVLARLLEAPPFVLSTGGGAYLSAENRALIAARGVAVWLDAAPDLLWARVRHRTTRPLLQTSDPKATLEALHGARAPFYAKAPIRVPSEPGLSVDEMAARVRGALEEAGIIVPEGYR